jgi:hypothetical protein
VSAAENDESLHDDVASAMRAIRNEGRKVSGERPELPDPPADGDPPARLEPLPDTPEAKLQSSPDREALNRIWNVAEAARQGDGLLARFVRVPLRRLVQFAMGGVLDRQVEMNSAQVKFDNELVEYVDARLDRISQHYDEVIGLHGKRMGEIDERHLILQQELVRHVHDMVQRIEFVFETAEQNHLYLEGSLRETREQLTRVLERLEAMGGRRTGEDEVR